MSPRRRRPAVPVACRGSRIGSGSSLRTGLAMARDGDSGRPEANSPNASGTSVSGPVSDAAHAGPVYSDPRRRESQLCYASMRIAILGAGGVGGYYGGILARAGHAVALLARGAHLEALRARGLEVRTPEGTFMAAVAATDEPRELGEVELAVVAVKSYSLPEIVPAARLLAERGADVLPLLNGVEAADRLVDQGVPGERVLGGLTEISAARLGPGVVERRSAFQRVVVGEGAAGGLSDRKGVV